MLQQLVKLCLVLAGLLLHLRIAPTSANEHSQAEHKHDKQTLRHPVRSRNGMRFTHRELSPSTFGFLFSFVFTRGLASFLSPPSWSWQSWHCWHPWYSCTTICSTSVLTSHLCPFTFASAHLTDHGTHLIELLEQLVDFLNGTAATTSNTFAPATIDDVGL